MSKNPIGDPGAKTVDARVARRRQDALGRRLRQMYDDVVSETVPADFLSLLGEADSARPKANGDDLEDFEEPERDAVGSKK